MSRDVYDCHNSGRGGLRCDKQFRGMDGHPQCSDQHSTATRPAQGPRPRNCRVEEGFTVEERGHSFTFSKLPSPSEGTGICGTRRIGRLASVTLLPSPLSPCVWDLTLWSLHFPEAFVHTQCFFNLLMAFPQLSRHLHISPTYAQDSNSSSVSPSTPWKLRVRLGTRKVRVSSLESVWPGS